jgi:hypothetical protein
MAYLLKPVYCNPASMPPGIFGRVLDDHDNLTLEPYADSVLLLPCVDEIYQWRERFLVWLLSDIYDYRQKLVEAVASPNGTDRSICAEPSKTRACAREQLQLLNNWMKEQKLGTTLYDDRERLPRGRSPTKLFTDVPIKVSELLSFHEERYQGKCGLFALASRIGQDGTQLLLRWMATNGGKAQLARPEHIAYMREQRKKLRI